MAQTQAENTEVDIEDTEVKTEEDKKDVLGERERIGHMTITVGKPKPYVHGDNFYQFCNRFIDFVTINEIKSKNLRTIFLSLVDNRTYGTLADYELQCGEAFCPIKLCDAYKKAMNPTMNNGQLLSALYRMTQIDRESVDDFICRINELACKLEMDKREIMSIKLSVFTNGLSSNAAKIEFAKFDEGRLRYEDAINMARKIEKIVTENNTEIPTISSISQPTDETSKNISENARANEPWISFKSQYRSNSRPRYDYDRSNSRSRYDHNRSNSRSRYDHNRSNSRSRYDHNRSNSRSRYDHNRSNSRSRYDHNRSNSRSRYYHNRSNSRSRYGRHNDNNGEYFRDQYGSGRGRRSDSPYGGRRANGEHFAFCRFCNRRGHSTYDCNNRRVRFNGVICGICNKPNHREEHCWHRNSEPCIYCKKFNHTSGNCRFKTYNVRSIGIDGNTHTADSSDSEYNLND